MRRGRCEGGRADWTSPGRRSRGEPRSCRRCGRGSPTRPTGRRRRQDSAVGRRCCRGYRAGTTPTRRRRHPPPPHSAIHATRARTHTVTMRQYIIYVAYNVAACGRSCGLPGLRRGGGGGGRLAGAAVLCCLVWRCELTAGQVRSASECVRRSHCTARHTSTLGRLNSHRHTRHDKTVVSGVAV